MTRFVTSMSLVLLLGSSFGSAHGQHRELPILNSIGRFLGYGYTQGGYHSVNGRPAFIQNRHPASNYASSHLQYAYQPGYQPMRTRIVQHQPLPAPSQHDVPRSYGPAAAMPGSAQAAPSPAVPTPPPVPQEPPPEWLKKYLQQKGQQAAEPVPAIEAESTSPSDKSSSEESLLAPPKNPLLMPDMDLLDAPEAGLLEGNDLLDGGDNLLDGADEDILLLDDDFSTQRVRPGSIPVRTISNQRVFNRYQGR